MSISYRFQLTTERMEWPGIAEISNSFDELINLGPSRICKLIINNAVIDLSNVVGSTKMLLKSQKNILSMVVKVPKWDCIKNRRIGLGHLANGCCRSCIDKEEYETIHQKCKRHFSVPYMLSIGIGSLNFIRSLEGFQD